MRLSLRQHTRYDFAEPARHLLQVLRHTPRSFEGQRVSRWQIDVDIDCVLRPGEDGYGNVVHTFSARGPCETLNVLITGEIENFDTAGLVRRSAERLPPELYLRATASTTPDPALRAFVRDVASGESALSKLHALMTRLHQTVRLDLDRVESGPAAAVFAAASGNGADMAQVFVTCARLIGSPARVVNGFYKAEGGPSLRHCWAEAHVDGLGWIGFDPAHDVCPQERHVRVATGLDGLAVAPVRGTHVDGATVTLNIEVFPN